MSAALLAFERATRLVRTGPFFAGHDERADRFLKDVGAGKGLMVDTSGTTGPRKTVVHTSDTLIGNACAFNAHMGFGPDNQGPRLRWFHCFPLDYMAGLLNLILCPYMGGGTVVLHKPLAGIGVRHFWEPVMANGCNAMWLSPRMCEAILRVNKDDAGREYCRDHVKYICVGTDKLKPETREAWEDRYETRLLPSYGSSELLIISATRPDDTEHPDSAGTPLPWVAVRHRPWWDNLTILTVSTAFAADGYWQQGRVSAHHMLEDQPPLYRTNDFGWREDSGHIYVGGRAA